MAMTLFWVTWTIFKKFKPMGLFVDFFLVLKKPSYKKDNSAK